MITRNRLRPARRGARQRDAVRKALIRKTLLFLVLAGLMVPSALAFDAMTLLPADPERLPSFLTIRSDDGRMDILTYQRSLLPALDGAGIPLGEEDLVSLPPDTPLEPGHSYTVTLTDRHRVRLSWNGVTVETITRPVLLETVLEESGFRDMVPDGRDRLVLPSRSIDPIRDGSRIAYVSVRSVPIKVLEPVPFTTVHVDDPLYRIGYSAVIQKGRDGEREVVYEDIYEDGILKGRQLAGSSVIRKPVSRIIRRGTSVSHSFSYRTIEGIVAAQYNRIRNWITPNGKLNYLEYRDNGDGTITVDGRTFAYTEKKVRVVTSYDGVEWCTIGHRNPELYPNCVIPREHATFSGLPARRGIVATYGFREIVGGDRRWVGTALPMGTVVFIVGYGLGVVGDIHNSRTGPTMLDACYDPREVLNGTDLGKTGRTVYILDMG